MTLNVTAIYRYRATAERVCEALEDIGVSPDDIHLIPESVQDVRSEDVPAGEHHPLQGEGFLTGLDEIGETGAMDRLHDLHLPEDDVRTYQQCIRRGDHVVSVEVDDDEVEKVRAVMRRPEAEAYDIEQRASEFTGESLIAHSAGEGHMLNEEWRARRIAAGDDSFLRTYERGARLGRIDRP